MSRKTSMYIGIACLMLNAFIAPAYARIDPDNDPWQDWQMTLTVKRLNHYLDYPSSSVRTLVMVNAEYAQPAKSRTKPPKPYERLYYTTDRPIGLKRVGELDITPGTAGIIKIPDLDPEDSFAVANAILRLYLDLSLNKCMTKCVLVPKATAAELIRAICQQGFHRGNTGSSRPSQVSLRIITDVPDDVGQILRSNP